MIFDNKDTDQIVVKGQTSQLPGNGTAASLRAGKTPASQLALDKFPPGKLGCDLLKKKEKE